MASTRFVNAAQGILLNVPFTDLTDDNLRFSFETRPIATFRMMQLCYPHFKAAVCDHNFRCPAQDYGTAWWRCVHAAAKEAIPPDSPRSHRWNGVRTTSASMPSALWHRAILTRGGSPTLFLSSLGRIGDPEKDIGTLVLFYPASPDCYMTGRTLQIDGGAGTWR